MRLSHLFTDLRERLRCRRLPNSPSRDLESPWQPLPRIAVLNPWFKVRGGVEVHADRDWRSLKTFEPEALAAPGSDLLRLANAILAEDGALPLRYGLVAFTRLGDPLLCLNQRETLWKAFEVPVYEQLRGPDGELLAAECDAHLGLHVHDAWVNSAPCPQRNGTSNHVHRVDFSPCECGQPSARLLRTDAFEPPRLAMAAAAASFAD